MVFSILCSEKIQKKKIEYYNFFLFNYDLKMCIPWTTLSQSKHRKKGQKKSAQNTMWYEKMKNKATFLCKTFN